MCRVLKVSVSGYYAWRKRPRSEALQRRNHLVVKIREIHRKSRQTYGSPRVHAVLQSSKVKCCENTVARLMRENQLRAKTRRKYKATTDSSHGLPVAPNRLEREFTTDRPNQVWVADITYLPTDEGWLYLASELDLY